MEGSSLLMHGVCGGRKERKQHERRHRGKTLQGRGGGQVDCTALVNGQQ